MALAADATIATPTADTPGGRARGGGGVAVPERGARGARPICARARGKTAFNSGFGISNLRRNARAERRLTGGEAAEDALRLCEELRRKHADRGHDDGTRVLEQHARQQAACGEGGGGGGAEGVGAARRAARARRAHRCDASGRGQRHGRRSPAGRGVGLSPARPRPPAALLSDATAPQTTRRTPHAARPRRAAATPRVHTLPNRAPRVFSPTPAHPRRPV